MTVAAEQTPQVESTRQRQSAAVRPEPPAAPEGAPWRWLIFLTVAAAALRAVALDQQLWYDEITTLVESVRRPLDEIVGTYQSQNQHTLFSILARISTVLLGEHAWSLRLPAVIFGVGCVPALYFCAREVASRRESLLAALLLTVSYHHIWFSQNARGYTMLAFWALVATFFFLRGLAVRRAEVWMSYGAMLALGFYTHLTMAFVAAGHGVVYLWWLAAERGESAEARRGQWTPLAGFAAGAAMTVALYAPVLSEIARRTVVRAGGEGAESEWTNPLWLVAETLRGLIAGLGGGAAAVAVAAGGALALAGLWSFWKQNRFFAGLVVLPMVFTAVVMLLVEHNLWPRFFFFAIGFAFLLLVRGSFAAVEAATGAAGAMRWATALVLLAAAASAWTVRAAWLYPKQDYVGAMEFVDAERQPGDAVVTVGMTSFPYRRYFGRDWLSVGTPEEMAMIREGRRVWLLYTVPIFLKSRHPDLWNIIAQDFETVRVFRGTLGDGEIYVCRTKSP